MKTTSKSPSKIPGKKNIARNDANDEEVAVIVDVHTNSEYYMFMVDTFNLGSRVYAVMIPYEPDQSRTKDSDLVIMRSQQTKNGDQIYISITDKKELNMAFEEFFRRYEESGEAQ